MAGKSLNKIAALLLEDHIKPALKAIGHWNTDSEMLVLGTAAVESKLAYRMQFGGGPAKGLWQIEKNTLYDIIYRYLDNRQILREKILTLNANKTISTSDLIHNDKLSAALCRVKYLMCEDPVPSKDNIWSQAAYWKMHYNTVAGKGTVGCYVKAWNECVI